MNGLKKFGAVLLLLFGSISAFAGHEMGGEIFWEYAGNNQFVFTAIVYYDCNTTPVQPSSSISIATNAPGGNFSCTLQNSIHITPQCNQPNLSLQCGVMPSNGEYAIKRVVYKSAPRTLAGTPPAGGWYFRHTLFSRQTVNVGSTPISFESRMFPIQESGTTLTAGQAADNSPQLDEAPHLSFEENLLQKLAVTSMSDPDFDSVFVALAPSKTSGHLDAAYAAGYHFSHPMVDSADFGTDHFSDLNGHSAQYIFKTDGGFYSFAFNLESFRNGQLISRIHRELTYMVEGRNPLSGNCDTLGNAPPNVFGKGVVVGFDSTQISAEINAQNDTMHYFAELKPGEELTFKVFASDSGKTENCSPQLIKSEILSPHFTAGANAPSWNAASSAAFNSLSGTLKWQPDTAIIPGFGQRIYHFRFAFFDDRCVVPAMREISLLVYLEDKQSLDQYSVNICQGDSVQVGVFTESANVVWRPATGVSDTTSAKPWFSPSISTNYAVKDLNSGKIDSLRIVVDTISTPVIVEENGAFLASTQATFSSAIWHINGAPAYEGIDTIAPVFSGEYDLAAANGACTAKSNALDTVIDISISANPVAIQQMLGSKQDSVSYKMEIKNTIGRDILLEQTVLFLEGLNAPSVAISVFDAQGNAILQTDSVAVLNEYLVWLPTEFLWPDGATFQFLIQIDTTRKLHTFQPTSWPIVGTNASIEIDQVKTDSGWVSAPSANANHIPFFTLQFVNDISVLEWQLQDFVPFPNPASDFIETGIVADFVVLNAQGQVLKKVVNTQKIDVSNLPNGLYFLQHTSGAIKKFVVLH